MNQGSTTSNDSDKGSHYSMKTNIGGTHIGRLDMRSKSLASASAIVLDDGNVHTAVTSPSQPSTKTLRPSLDTKVSRPPSNAIGTTSVKKGIYQNNSDDIVRSNQPNCSSISTASEDKTNTGRALSAFDMNSRYSITNRVTSDNNKPSRLQKSASILENSYTSNKNVRATPIISTSGKNISLTSETQQPMIHIISNPNFEQTTGRDSMDSADKDTDTTKIKSRTTKNGASVTNTSTKTKTSRNAIRIRFLRRLLSITFGRNSPQASTSAAQDTNLSLDSNASENESSRSDIVYGDKNSSFHKRGNSNLKSSHSNSYHKSKRGSHSSKSISFTQQPSTNTSVAGLDDPNSTSPKRTLHHQSSQQVSVGADEIGTKNLTIKDNEKSPKVNSLKPKNQTIGWFTTNDPDITKIDGKSYLECPLCVLLVDEASTPDLEVCNHRICLECMQRYITTEINHSRLNITCPSCSEALHPNTIKEILQNEKYYLKYESFMLRRVLAAEPDARWCPAPDCGYVVLANGCASCPKLVCGREGCNTSFCYHCKQEWHPNKTCSAASIQRNKRLINAYNIGDLIEESSQLSSSNRKSSKSSQNASIKVDDIRECPVCASRIIKMNDGSCNHMTCSICETDFCWLCMREISDLHYFSPSGCTFWGKKPWSRKKKLLWQLGMLVGAPICIILLAGIAVPAIVIGIPVWAARKLHNRLERKPCSRYRKNAIITGGVLLSFVVSPIISAVALAIGVPILLGYVYGVVPFSLCRSSGGCLSSAPSLENIQNEIQNIQTEMQTSRNIQAKLQALELKDGISIDTAMSHKLGDPSIGETSLYMSNISLETNSIGHVTTVERDDRESASNAALAGSIISQNNYDDGNSTRALAGSIISKESGYTLVPAEVHTATTSNVVLQTSTKNGQAMMI